MDVLGLEVGYRLIPMVDKGQDGELLKRIRGLRKKFAGTSAFLAAPVHIRDNLELKPNAYRIVLKGVEIGTGSAFPGSSWRSTRAVSGPLAGRETTDPAFGLPAVWIDASQREQAHALGYTVVDASTVVATHLNHLILSHAPNSSGAETQACSTTSPRTAPSWWKTWCPSCCRFATVQRVLQNLLDEGVNIRDMRSIVEVLAEFAPRSRTRWSSRPACARPGPGDRPEPLPGQRRGAGDGPRSGPRTGADAGHGGGGPAGRRHRAGPR